MGWEIEKKERQNLFFKNQIVVKYILEYERDGKRGVGKEGWEGEWGKRAGKGNGERGLGRGVGKGLGRDNPISTKVYNIIRKKGGEK